MSRLQATRHRIPGGAPSAHASHHFRLARFVMLGVLVIWLAVACADDTENRQFATDKRTPQPTPTTTTVQSREATPAYTEGHTLASPEALVDRRGAPNTVYLLVESTLWAVEDDGARALDVPEPVAFAASPSGDRVAVVQRSGDTFDLGIYQPDGSEVNRFEAVVEPVAVATPVANDEAAGVTISWAPSGGSVLLGTENGDLLDVQLSGDVRQIQSDAALDGLQTANWSPRGDQIAIVQRDDDGYGRLALLDIAEEGPARVNVIAPVGQVAGQKASVESVGWKPYGDGVLFLQGNVTDSGIRNGQLVSWDMASNTTKVMATGGQAGPTGSISQFTVAPDGRAVAYVIEIPGAESRQFGGVYIRSLVTGQYYRVPVAPQAAAEEIRWLGDGLAWLAVPRASDADEGAAASVEWIDRHGAQRTVATLGSTVATPVASPVASPAAGTPGATPVASPMASPEVISSPVATSVP